MRRPGIGIRLSRGPHKRRGSETLIVANVSRPPRFVITVPVAWRPRGEEGWLDGVSVNVSRSGVLIETDRRPVIGTLVDFVISLSQLDTPQYEVADVACAGRVVRSERDSAGRLCKFAATIDAYSLIRKPD